MSKKKTSVSIDVVIPKLSCKFGAPKGRASIGTKPIDKRVYDRFVPMCSCCGAYDVGGAYWGLGRRLRVAFTEDLTYVRFYREGQ